MADRTSAEVFGLFFGMLAENPTDENKAMARRVYGMTHGYDFNTCQMCVDSSLEILGLARLGVDPKHPEDGEVMLYGPEES